MNKKAVFPVAVFILLVGTASVLGQNVSPEAKSLWEKGKNNINNDDFEMALAWFENAAKLAPDWPEIFHDLGVLTEAMGEYAKAVRSYRRYIQLAPQADDADEIERLLYVLEIKAEPVLRKEFSFNLWLYDSGLEQDRLKMISNEILADVSHINTPGTDGWTALHLAARKDDINFAKRLLSVGADVNAKGGTAGGLDLNLKPYKLDWTALHIAAYRGEKEFMELLLAHGALVNAKGGFGDTPLYLASRDGQVESAGLLIARGADMNARDILGNTPLHEAAREGHKQLAELLIVKGALINAKDSLGQTPLHRAAEHGQKEVAELLIFKGAKINMKDDDDDRPLALATKNNHQEVVDLLKKHGAK